MPRMQVLCDAHSTNGTRRCEYGAQALVLGQKIMSSGHPCRWVALCLEQNLAKMLPSELIDFARLGRKGRGMPVDDRHKFPNP